MCFHIRSISWKLLFFAGCAALYSHWCRADDSPPFPTIRAVVYGDGTAGPYTVGRGFIGGTAFIDSTVSSVVLSAVSTDHTSGTVTFDRPLSDRDSVTVVIGVPPVWVKEAYRRVPGGQGDRQYPPARMPEQSAESVPGRFPGLRFGGSKTFDVNVGSDRETALNQTLRLSITGKMTEDITLNASISDQNIPISPEGDTRELEELDRVFIELRGSRFSIDMGDTDLRNEAGRWLSYERRLSGARAAVRAGGVELFGSGAVSEGRHMSVTITPIEGTQGPYRLITERGDRTISLIPGTETLWINGEKLTRGTYDDYTIDYTTGEVMFTERRIIGADMRIVCDYEYTSESYRRNFYSTGARGVFWGNRLTVSTVLAREADDPGRRVAEELDKTMRSALALSGDDPAVIDGVSPASGDTTGTYERVNDHLVYNPQGNGRFSAVFSWVGADQGSYRYRGGGIYEFVPPERRGPGSGASYDPVSIVSGPVSHDLAGITMSFDPHTAVHLETELAGSSVDLNTLSGLDDTDNGGGAHRMGLKLSPGIPFVVPLKLDVSGNYRSRDRTFKPLDRDREAEENRLWGLPLVIADTHETVSEMSAGLSVHTGMLSGTGFALNAGQAEFGGSARSKRTGGEGHVMIPGFGTASAALYHILREDIPGLPDGQIDRFTLNASSTVAGFTPTVAFERELSEGTGGDSSGSSYDDIRTVLAAPEFGSVTGTCEWFYRTEQAKRVSWSDSSFARGGSVGFSAGRGGQGMFRSRYSRRERVTGRHRIATDQALIDYSYRPRPGFFQVDGTYRAGRSREASKRKNFIYIGDGRGLYRWEDTNGDSVRDPDEFIPDEHGSYYLYEETLEDYRPVNIVSVFGKLGIDIPAWLVGRIAGASLPVRSETTYEINEKSSAPASDVFLLKLSRFRKAGTTATGDSRIQEDMTVPVAGSGSARLRYFRYDLYNAEYVTGSERRGEEEISLRLRLPAGEDSDTEFTVKRAVMNRAMETRSTGDYRVKALSGTAGVSVYPYPRTKVGFTLGGGRDRDDRTGITVRYYSARPSVTYRFPGRGSIEASYMVTSVSLGPAESTGSAIPYTMAQGCKEGKNHDISVVCDYRLSNSMNIIASYTGRQFGGQEFENFARAQVRALF